MDAFQAGDVDFVNISPDDASWIRYDRTLGPQLRRADDLSVDYFGFDTTRAPFDDPRVRQAFAWAVDWDALVRLVDPDSVPATSIVPAGHRGPRHARTSAPGTTPMRPARRSPMPATPAAPASRP